MNREEATIILDTFKNNPLFNEQHKQAFDMAISALSAEEISEDGTLKVNVADGSKVKRVLVWGDNIFGGLYYPDSAEPKSGEWEDIGYPDFDHKNFRQYRCSVCNDSVYEQPINIKYHKYCLHCGAKMGVNK